MIRVEDVRFQYPSAEFSLVIPHLHISQKQRIAIVGPSGCGKTTFISLICGILQPQVGDILFEGTSLQKQSEADRRRIRISRIGMVFQEFELMEYLSVRENILLPFLVNSSLKIDRAVRKRVEQLADSVGIADKLSRFPRALSQGERQRIVICRAMLTKPRLLIADEPTGNLDSNNASKIMDQLFAQVAEVQGTLLMVTHDQSLLDRFDNVIDMTAMNVGDAS